MSAGKVKKRDNQRKYNAYEKRIQKQIDKVLRNLYWIAENRPDLLQDLETELLNDDLPMKRRARTLLKIVSLFENEPTVFSLIAEIYSEHIVSLEKKYPKKRIN